MANLNLTDTLAAIGRLDEAAARIVTQLDLRTIAAEPDAVRAGTLRRSHQVLQDYCHQSELARAALRAARVEMIKSLVTRAA